MENTGRETQRNGYKLAHVWRKVHFVQPVGDVKQFHCTITQESTKTQIMVENQ